LVRTTGRLAALNEYISANAASVNATNQQAHIGKHISQLSIAGILAAASVNATYISVNASTSASAPVHQRQRQYISVNATNRGPHPKPIVPRDQAGGA
jgi:hypothetical protein